VALSSTPNSSYVWNPAGTGDADRSLPFPLLLLSSNSTEAVRARAAANTATCAPALLRPLWLRVRERQTWCGEEGEGRDREVGLVAPDLRFCQFPTQSRCFSSTAFKT